MYAYTDISHRVSSGMICYHCLRTDSMGLMLTSELYFSADEKQLPALDAPLLESDLDHLPDTFRGKKVYLKLNPKITYLGCSGDCQLVIY